MQITKISQSNGKEFVQANQDSFMVLVFDAEFTDQAEIVEKATQAVADSNELDNKIVLAVVDAEQNDDLTKELGVLSVPMVVFMNKGKAVRKIDTLEPTNLVNSIKEELNKHEIPTEETDPKKRLQEYLNQLVNRSTVMIFMKGNPKAPRCGFSKQLMELLGGYEGIKFDTFDILLDEDVRQGLKEYSDWPTYPQIYVKGEFVGGLDILKQLDETGELESTLKV